MNNRNDVAFRSNITDFQRRGEPNFAWAKTLSVFSLLPGLHGFWPMSIVDDTGNAICSFQGANLARNGNPYYNLSDLAPYIDLDGTGDFLSTWDSLTEVVGTESYIDPSLRGLTIGGWFNFDSLAADLPLITKYTAAGNQRSYRLMYDQANGVIKFGVSSNGTAMKEVYSTIAEAISKWYFIVGRFRPSTEVAIWVNAYKNADTTSVPASLFNPVVAPFLIGAQDEGVGALLDGKASLCFLTVTALPDGIIQGLFQQTRPLFGAVKDEAYLNPGSPSLSASPSVSASRSPSVSPSASISPSSSLSKSASRSLSPSASASPSPSRSISPSASGSRSGSPSPSPSASPSTSPSVGLSGSASASPSASRSLSPSASKSPSASLSISQSGSPSPSSAPVYYYVDFTTGNDADDGLSEANAWKTLTKVNATAFSAGNHILFKRGETWVGELVPSSNGNAGDPIVYGAYGSGARPIIDGLGTHFAACWVPSDHHHLRFESLDFYRNNAAAQFGAFYNEGHDVYVYDCIARSSQYFGFNSESATGLNIYNIVYDSCEAYDNDQTGIVITSRDELGVCEGPHDCEIKNCIAHDNGVVEWADHGIYVKHGVSVHDNVCYDNTMGAGVKLNANSIHSTWSPVAYNNVCYQNKIGLHAGHQSSLIYNNLLYDNSYNVDFDGDSHDVTFVFNTLANAINVSGNTPVRIEGEFHDMIFKNNLIVQDWSLSARYLMRGTGTTHMEHFAANNDIDYNVYYSDENVATGTFYDTSSLYSWTQWLALPGAPDANSLFLTDLPDVVTRYTDMHPTDGGNIKGQGVWIAGYNMDYDYNARLDPPTPGCYEEQEAP